MLAGNLSRFYSSVQLLSMLAGVLAMVEVDALSTPPS